MLKEQFKSKEFNECRDYIKAVAFNTNEYRPITISQAVELHATFFHNPIYEEIEIYVQAIRYHIRIIDEILDVINPVYTSDIRVLKNIQNMLTNFISLFDVKPWTPNDI